MKHTKLARAIILAASSALCVASAASADEEADHEALRQLVREYEAAVQKGDPSLLQPHLAAGFTGVMITGEAVDSFESLDAYWERIQALLGDGGTYRVKVNVAELATIVGDVAFARGTTEDTAVTSDGKEYQFEGFWTAICTREADGWKILRVHGSMDAITNTFVKTALRTTATSTAIIGGIVGFAVGAILFWLVGRRRRSLPAAA
jgi:ketosteroid isomerase-like protein